MTGEVIPVDFSRRKREFEAPLSDERISRLSNDQLIAGIEARRRLADTYFERSVKLAAHTLKLRIELDRRGLGQPPYGDSGA